MSLLVCVLCCCWVMCAPESHQVKLVLCCSVFLCNDWVLLYMSCLYMQEMRSLAWSVTLFPCNFYDLFSMCHELCGSAPRHPGNLWSLVELEASLLCNDVINKWSHTGGLALHHWNPPFLQCQYGGCSFLVAHASPACAVLTQPTLHSL